jgi:polysaccharide export outer membrane protein
VIDRLGMALAKVRPHEFGRIPRDTTELVAMKRTPLDIAPTALVALWLATSPLSAKDPAVSSAEDPAPADRSVVATSIGDTQAYKLGAADVVEVFVWREPELSRTLTVRPDGFISLPLAGELVAAGRTPQDLEEQITHGLREYIEDPLVTVIVKEIKSPTISVLGEVLRPGRYVIPQRTTVLDAIAMSGGFTEFARPDRVTVIHRTATGTEQVRVHVKRLLEKGGEPFYLAAGDAVHVE